jgi:hypothetical protein
VSSNDFELDVRVATPHANAVPQGFLSIGSTCYSCHYTCYTSQDCGTAGGKFCTLACSDSGCCSQ